MWTPGHNRVLCSRELCYPIQLAPRDPLSYMEINEVIEGDPKTILKVYENKERQRFTSFGGFVHKVHFVWSCWGWGTALIEWAAVIWMNSSVRCEVWVWVCNVITQNISAVGAHDRTCIRQPGCIWDLLVIILETLTAIRSEKTAIEMVKWKRQADISGYICVVVRAVKQHEINTLQLKLWQKTCWSVISAQWHIYKGYKHSFFSSLVVFLFFPSSC